MKYADLSIRMKYIVMLLSLVFLPFFFAGMLLLHLWSGQQKENAHRTQIYQLNLMNRELEAKLSEAENALVTLGSDRQLQEILKSRRFEGKYYPILLRRKIETVMKETDLIDNIQIWKNGEIFWQSGSVTWIPEEKITDQPSGCWSPIRKMYSFFHGDFKQENEVCSFLNTIYYGTTENQYAVIAINIREETVESCYNNLKTGIGEESFLSNRNGGIVSFSGNKFPDEWMDIISKAELTTSDSGFKNLEIGKKKYELYWTKNRNTGGFLWKLRETDQDILAWSPWVYTGVLLGIVSLSILSCLYVWERYINRPLRELSKSMDTIQQGDLEVLTLSEGKDEIGSLMAGFNEMVVRLKNLIDKVYKEQILRQKAELDLMTTQINPHFLYNTIDSIHWTALAQGDEEVGEQLEVLSDFLRGSLNFGRQEVSLKEELELVDNYCYLVQKRFHGRIDFQQQVDKQAYEMAVPKLIVQLLIENAFSHGLKHRFENGKIKLCIHIRKDRLVIKVGDNGLGCDEYEIRKELEKTESARCFALLNVKQRLELLYGADGKFRFYSRKNQGTLVSIQIPATRKEF